MAIYGKINKILLSFSLMVCKLSIHFILQLGSCKQTWVPCSTMPCGGNSSGLPAKWRPERVWTKPQNRIEDNSQITL